MSDSLTLLVQITAKPECAQAAKAELLKILEPTRAEDGCVSYELYFDDNDSTKFIFVETWQTRAHWEAHNSIAHLKPFLTMAEAGDVSAVITEMTKHSGTQ